VKKFYPLLIIVIALWWFSSCESTSSPASSNPTFGGPEVTFPISPIPPNLTPTVTAAPTIAPDPAATSQDPDLNTSQALTVAKTLIERGRSASTNYDRDAFGSAWKDVDRNGCDTRNDILQRDFTTSTFKAGTNECKVIGGTWTDPYSNESYMFTEQPSGAQIDHVVALKNAWEMGADLWSDQMRLEFANDPLNLIVTVASLNAQKSDSNAASWLPPYKPGRCAFIARQVAVKDKWELFVTSSEKDAMISILTKPGCSETKLPN
jgi:hypothetical protein